MILNRDVDVRAARSPSKRLEVEPVLLPGLWMPSWLGHRAPFDEDHTAFSLACMGEPCTVVSCFAGETGSGCVPWMRIRLATLARSPVHTTLAWYSIESIDRDIGRGVARSPSDVLLRHE